MTYKIAVARKVPNPYYRDGGIYRSSPTINEYSLSHTGTLLECIAWRRKNAAGLAQLVNAADPNGDLTDVSEVDFSREDAEVEKELLRCLEEEAERGRK